MTTLTLDAIRNNPWNAVTQELPRRPPWFLLQAAYCAANYCRTAEYGFLILGRDGLYAPHGWRPSANCPNASDPCLQRGDAAHRRLEEVRRIYKRRFDEDLDRLF
jgi:hypothetical protein